METNDLNDMINMIGNMFSGQTTDGSNQMNSLFGKLESSMNNLLTTIENKEKEEVCEVPDVTLKITKKLEDNENIEITETINIGEGKSPEEKREETSKFLDDLSNLKDAFPKSNLEGKREKNFTEHLFKNLASTVKDGENPAGSFLRMMMGTMQNLMKSNESNNDDGKSDKDDGKSDIDN